MMRFTYTIGGFYLMVILGKIEGHLPLAE